MLKKILLSIFLTLGFCLGAHALSVNTILGSPNETSLSAGTKPQTKLTNARSVAKDSSGNLYLSVHHAIIKLDTNGNSSIFAGDSSTGSTDGQGTAARFYNPEQIAIDNADNLYIADSSNHIIRKITSDGVVTTIAGDGTAGDVDGAALSARLNTPRGIVVDSTGKIYFSDNAGKIKMLSGATVTTVAGIGSGDVDGAGLTTARFSAPHHLFLKNDNEIYIADYGNHKIKKITYDGFSWSASTVAGVGTAGNTDGDISVAEIKYPISVVESSNGDLFISSWTGYIIKRLSGTNMTTVAGTFEGAGLYDGNGSDAAFYYPRGMFIDSEDNIYLASYGSYLLRLIKPYSNYVEDEMTVFAGNSNAFVDGRLGLAKFYSPYDITKDSSGNYYIADYSNHRVRKILSNGSVTTFAGDGTNATLDGTGTGAKIGTPIAVAVDSNDNVFVAQAGAHIIRKISPAGVVTTFAGSGAQGSADGNGTSASFKNPRALAIDSSDNIYVADYGNNAIRKISSAGVVTTVINNGSGNVDGYVSSGIAKIGTPRGLTINSSGDIIIADGNNAIRKLSYTGSDYLLETIAGGLRLGFRDGLAGSASFSTPEKIIVDNSDNIYVADSSNNCIRKVTPSGVVTTIAGSRYDGAHIGTRANGSFMNPVGLMIDNSNLYVTDASSHKILKINNILSASALDTSTDLEDLSSAYEYSVSTVVGSGSGNVYGPVGAALINPPRGIVFDSNSDLFIADNNNQIQKLNFDTNILSLYSGASGTGSDDGDKHTAKFYSPSGISFDSAGNLFVADQNNDLIRKVFANGSVITFAGSTAGYVDDTGTSAKFDTPLGLVHDSSDNIFVTDYRNHRIRKISPAGVVTTFAGSSSGHLDGLGTNAKFTNPHGLAIDSSDNLYVADRGNNMIRKITPVGLVTTLAGSGNVIYKDGNASEAGFSAPIGIAVDSEGSVFFSDDSNRIRKLSPEGVVSTFTGHSGVAGAQDGSLDIASFNNIQDLKIDDDDNLYVADYGNSRIRKISKTRVSSNNNSSSSPSVIFVGGGDENSKPGIEIYHSNFDEVSSLSLAYAKTYKLKAFAYDGEDGQNIYNSLSWTSDIDGSLGSDRVLDTSTLSEGTHTLTASVRDSGGLNASAVITVTITESTSPETENSESSSSSSSPVLIDLVKAKIKGKKVLRAVAVTTDASGNLVNVSDEIVWTSDLDGVLNRGDTLNLKNVKSLGKHTVSANYGDVSKSFKIKRKRKGKAKKKSKRKHKK